MALKLICGPAASGKTSRALQAFEAALNEGDRPVLIAPNQPDVRHYQRSILRGSPVISGAEVTTFSWFVFHAGQGDPKVRRRVSGIERQLILRATVQGARKLEYLTESSRYEGFIRVLGELLAQLQAAGVTPSVFADACTGLLHHDLNAGLFEIYSQYLDILGHQQLVDSEMEYRWAIESLRRNPGTLAERVFIVDGFYDFTSLQIELLELAAGHAAELIVTLPYIEGSSAYRASAGFYQTMSTWPGCDCEFLPAAAQKNGGTDIGHVRDQLFSDEPQKARWQGAVRFLQGAGVRGQAELVAAEILDMTRAGEAALDDIVVVCRSLGADARAITSVFNEFGIPWDYSGRELLRDTPVGQAAIALLDYLAATIDGVASQVGPGLAASAADSLLRFLRQASPGSARVDEFARELSLHDIEEPERLREKWEAVGGWPLRELDALEKAAATGMDELEAELETVLTGIAGRNLDRAGETSAELTFLESGSDKAGEARALVAVIRILREAARLRKAGALPAQAAVDDIREAIATALLDLPFGNRRGCVRVVDPHRMMNQRFDAVFICGLLEKQFPIAQRVDPFLSEDARRRLKDEHGIALEAGGRDAWIDEERFLFHRTVTRANKHLFLCLPYCDSQGGANVPSIFVDEVARLFDGLSDAATRHKRISDITFPIEEAPTPAAALHALCREAGNLHTGRSRIPKRLVRKIERAAKPAGIGGRAARCLEAVVPPVFHPGEYIREHFSRDDMFSATALQKYASCPFAFFVERGLRPAAMELKTFFLDRGKLAHMALAVFGARMHGSHVVLGRADAEQIRAAHEQIDRALDKAVAEVGLDHSIDSQVMVATLRHHLHCFIDEQHSAASELDPELFEYGFGGVKPQGQGSSGFTEAAPLLGGWVKLRGAIDRIDIKPGTNKAVVVDYKTNFETAWGKWLENGEIQMPLYMVAAKAMGLEVIGGGYYSLFKGKEFAVYLEEGGELLGTRLTNKNVASGEELESLTAGAERIAVAAADGIRAGAFAISSDRDSCRNCDFGGVCRA